MSPRSPPTSKISPYGQNTADVEHRRKRDFGVQRGVPYKVDHYGIFLKIWVKICQKSKFWDLSANGVSGLKMAPEFEFVTHFNSRSTFKVFS